MKTLQRKTGKSLPQRKQNDECFGQKPDSTNVKTCFGQRMQIWAIRYMPLSSRLSLEIHYRNLTVTLLVLTASEKRDGSSLTIFPPRSSPLVTSKACPDRASTEVALNCIKADFSIISAASLLITPWMGPTWSARIWNRNSIMLFWVRRSEVGGGSAGLRGDRDLSLAVVWDDILHKGVAGRGKDKRGMET